jgi:hypothetical protein
MKKWMSQRCLTLATMAGLMTVGMGAAHANITSIFQGVTPDGPNYKYTYAIGVDAAEKVIEGDYFTINDFDGFVPGTDNVVSAFGPWTFAPEATSTAPPQIPFVLPTDTGILNLRWNYNGGSPIPGSTAVPFLGTFLGTFSADSIYPTPVHGILLGRATSQMPDTNNLKDGNVANTFVPFVPEPCTMSLLGLGGLPLLRALRRRRVDPTDET